MKEGENSLENMIGNEPLTHEYGKIKTMEFILKDLETGKVYDLPEVRGKSKDDEHFWLIIGKGTEADIKMTEMGFVKSYIKFLKAEGVEDKEVRKRRIREELPNYRYFLSTVKEKHAVIHVYHSRPLIIPLGKIYISGNEVEGDRKSRYLNPHGDIISLGIYKNLELAPKKHRNRNSLN
jgi:hypothetical protein